LAKSYTAAELKFPNLNIAKQAVMDGFIPLAEDHFPQLWLHLAIIPYFCVPIQKRNFKIEL
jgi:hypothetical protein